MDIFLPEGTQNGAAILFIHGGGWHAGKREDWHRIMEVYCAHGYVCATASYRLTGQAAYPAQIEDMREAMHFFKAQAARLGFDPNRIAAYGSSAGGHLCLQLATDTDVSVRPACTVALCPVTCLAGEELRNQNFVKNLVGASFEEAPDAFRAATPDYGLSDGLPPVLLVHGDKDSTIPCQLSDRFCRQYLAAGNLAQLHTLPDTEHGFGYAAQTPCQLETIRLALDFMDRHLLRPEENLALNQDYRVSFPGLEWRSGDEENVALTDGRIPDTVGGAGWLLTDLTQQEFSTKGFTGEFIDVPAWDALRTPRFSVMVDFGFLQTVRRVEAVFGRDSGNRIDWPERTEVYLSDDGYNFTYYPIQQEQREEDGDFCRHTVTFASAKRAKAVRLVVYAPENTVVAMAEYQVYGISEQVKEKLPVKTATAEAGAVITTDTKDPRNNQRCGIYQMELDGEQPLSEITVEALAGEDIDEPRYVAAFYSLDGVNFTDFGTSHLRHAYGTPQAYTAVYTITRNHTVSARYVRLHIYTETAAKLKQIGISGATQPVPEPLYGHMGDRALEPHTNLLEDQPVLVNGESVLCLTDQDYLEHTLALEPGTAVLEYVFDHPVQTLNSVALYFHVTAPYGLPRRVTTELKVGDDWKVVCTTFHHHETDGRAVVRQLFDDHAAEGLRITVEADDALCWSQVAAYNGRPQLPIIHGGFINPNFMNVSNNEGTAHLDDYMWYMQLKGMKDLGMDILVLHYTTNKRYMLTLLRNAPRLEERGYKELHIYNTEDPLEAIMQAADKLNMKLFLGTCLGLGFNRVPEDSYHDEVIEEAKITIDYLMEQYGHHPSFYGYYFSDEASDEWLMMDGAIGKFRHIYGSQSAYIRERDPGKPCLICPAIWRNTTPEESHYCLYELLRSETDGGRPIVDIVAQQDCLGRPTDLILPKAIYGEFERHVQEWATAIRAAGAEFWNDLEAFNFNIISKHIEDTINALEIESRYTGCNIVFDIVNYFSPLCRTGRLSATHRGAYSWQCAREDDYLQRYVQFYRTLYGDSQRWGSTGCKKRSGS